MVYKPTDRERQRYIVYTGTNPLPTFTKLFGTHGIAAAGLQLRGNTIRTTSAYIDHVKAAICLTPGCQSVRVSGALKNTK
jgi:hypothetical protein